MSSGKGKVFPITLLQLLQWCWEIRAMISRLFLLSNSDKKGRILGLSSDSFMMSSKDGWSRTIKEEGISSPAMELMK